MRSSRWVGRDIGEIERRVLAQQHDVELAQVRSRALRRASAWSPCSSLARCSGCASANTSRAVQRQSVGRVIEQCVAARLRLEQQSEGRIAGDVDPLDRIHLHGDGQRHGGRSSLSISRSQRIRCDEVAGKAPGATKTASPRSVALGRPGVAREPDPRRRGRCGGACVRSMAIAACVETRRAPSPRRRRSCRRAAATMSISPPRDGKAAREHAVSLQPQPERGERFGAQTRRMGAPPRRRCSADARSARRAPPRDCEAPRA